MKLHLHKSNERGTSNLGWLKSNFSFSFANYFDQNRMGFGALRVLNDDTIAGGSGFGTHPHSDMEIISIPLEGELAHKDSMGVEETIAPGQIQVMSAGSGLTHSEYNHLKDKETKFLQIWIHPKEAGIEPRHDQKTFDLEKNKMTVVVEGEDNADTLYIHQDAKISLGEYDQDAEIEYTPAYGNGVFVFPIEGHVNIDGIDVHKRDSAEITEATSVGMKIAKDSKVMLIEVPM